MYRYLKKLYSWLYAPYIYFRAKSLKGWQLYYSRRLKLTLLLNCDYLIDFIIRETGAFEREVLRAMDTFHLQVKGGVFIDVGSQLGQFSLYVTCTYPEIEVLSFEPNPRAYQQQRANMMLNRLSYTLLAKGLSNEAGKAVLHLPAEEWHDAYGKKNEGAASLYAAHCPGGKAQEVELDLLNNFRQHWEGAGAILIKIDVEGAELQVLQGGDHLFGANKSIYLVIEHLWKDEAEKASEVRELLTHWGFVPCDADWKPLKGATVLKNGNYFYFRPASW